MPHVRQAALPQGRFDIILSAVLENYKNTRAARKSRFCVEVALLASAFFGAHVLLCTLRASKSGFLAVNEKSCVSVLENDKNTRAARKSRFFACCFGWKYRIRKIAEKL